MLGRSMHFWGSMLGGPPNLLVSLGLIILSPRLASRSSRLTRTGYTLTLIGLLVPAAIDLYIGALGAPLFVPVVGVGLILLALGSRHNPQLKRQSLYLLMLIGIFQVVAFALALLPLEVSDSIGGYRTYGIFAHFLSGAGWVAFGVSYWQSQATIVIEPRQN